MYISFVKTQKTSVQVLKSTRSNIFLSKKKPVQHCCIQRTEKQHPCSSENDWIWMIKLSI